MTGAGSRITVFWEDSAAKGDLRSYGPTSLLRACVADVRGLSGHWALKTNIAGQPLNGNEAVLKHMTLCALNGAPHPAIFTLDYDKIPDVMKRRKLDDPSCMSGRRDGLRTDTQHSQAILVFVRDNTEDLLRALRNAAVGQGILMHKPWDGAINHKDMKARDDIFNAVASPEHANVRTQAQKLNPSLGYLVKKVHELLS